MIRHLGVSSVDAAQLAEARAIALVAAVQNAFHVHATADVALLAGSPVRLPIPGTGSLARLEENVGAASPGLTPEYIASLGG